MIKIKVGDKFIGVVRDFKIVEPSDKTKPVSYDVAEITKFDTLKTTGQVNFEQAEPYTLELEDKNGNIFCLYDWWVSAVNYGDFDDDSIEVEHIDLVFENTDNKDNNVL